MKYLIGLVIILILTSCGARRLKSKETNDFIILLGSGFKSDTVSLNIDDKEIFKNRILESDSISGIVRSVSILKNKKTVTLLNAKNEILNAIKIDDNDIILVDIEINHKQHKLTIPLRKGYIVKIDSQPFYNKVDVFQSKKTIVLD